MENNVLPVWKTHGSLGKSILTYEVNKKPNSNEDDFDIHDDAANSIIVIAKKHNINPLVVIEDSFLSFPSLYKYCKKHEIQLVFGLNFNLCNDVKEKSDKSLLTNSKVSVLMKNSAGYPDLIKLHDAINSNAENFYYEPRGDWAILREYWTENLELVIPPFDNFIHKNYLQNGTCIPNFGDVNRINPIITYANMELSWNSLLNEALVEYAKNNNYRLQEVHPIYYYKKDDFKAYTLFRAIDNRGDYFNTKIDFFDSNCFNFENYLEKTGGKL